MRWEYLILQDMHDIHMPGRLNALGAEGWELVGFGGGNIPCFKRALPEPPPTPPKKPAKRKPAKRSVKPKV